MAVGREASCRQPSSIRLSTRGTQSRSPPQKLPEGKDHAAGMYPSKPVPASPSNHVNMSPGSPARMCASRFQGNLAEVSPRTPADKYLTPSVLKNVHLFMFPFFIFPFYNEFTNNRTLKYRLKILKKKITKQNDNCQQLIMKHLSFQVIDPG